jgi:hypothetical protein
MLLDSAILHSWSDGVSSHPYPPGRGIIRRSFSSGGQTVKTFAFALVLLAFIVVPGSTQPPQSEAGPQCGRMMGMKMPASKLAEIRVYPLEQFKQDQADVERLRQIVRELRSSADTRSAGSAHHAQLEQELFRLLDKHLERSTSDQGKSETAIAVQTRLNQMEGKMMCGACHGMGMSMGAMPGSGGR